MTNFERTLDIIRERITPRLRPEYRKIWVQGSTRPSLTTLIFTIFDKDRYVMEFIDIKGFRNYRPDVEDIVDERVFNKEDYPDFINWYVKNINLLDLPSHIMTSFKSLEDYARYTEEVINGTRYGSSQPDNTNYDKWVEFIGGKKNVFLRGFLKNFKLS